MCTQAPGGLLLPLVVGAPLPLAGSAVTVWPWDAGEIRGQTPEPRPVIMRAPRQPGRAKACTEHPARQHRRGSRLRRQSGAGSVRSAGPWS